MSLGIFCTYIHNLIGGHVVVTNGAFHRLVQLFARDLAVAIQVVGAEKVAQALFVRVRRRHWYLLL